MRRRRRRSRYDPAAEDENPIDILPLIDIMFLLLCFFIFLSLAMVLQEGVTVDLARAVSGEPVSPRTDRLVVSVRASGDLYLNQENVDEAALKARLQARAEDDARQPVYLNVDGKATHERVMTAMDVIRRAGLTNLVFTVEPNEAGAP